MYVTRAIYRLGNSRSFSENLLRASYARSARASHARRACLSPVSLSIFSLASDLLFDCTRVLEYVKIPTVLQSSLFMTRMSKSTRPSYWGEEASGRLGRR